MNYRFKELVAGIPKAVALYDAIRGGRPRTRYNLEQLSSRLADAANDVRQSNRQPDTARKIVLFATLHYWIEQAAMIGLVLRGMGHTVTLAYLPYGSWEKPISRFDLERQDLYTRRVLSPLIGLVRVESLLGSGTDEALPQELVAAVRRTSEYDVMYSLQVEDIHRNGALYGLREQRNLSASRAALALLRSDTPDIALIPNGLVTELAVFYQTARYLRIPAVTYEFNDQREQIWIAQNDVVMHQNTDNLWRARGSVPLNDAERVEIQKFEAARESGQLYGKGTRRWQDEPSQGAARLRDSLGLDDRPVALLATNVLGDSLTLGRNLFASSMGEWIDRTARYFVNRKDIQLVVRIHPGERLIRGPSMLRVIERAIPRLPEHLHIVGARDSTNTYDLMSIADLGLVYTTTVGMEMAMRGVPVIVAGRTHYRERGFVMSPNSWSEYFGMLDAFPGVATGKLRSAEIEVAWTYAYRFFFEYAFDFPWRLMHFWKDFESWPIGRLLSDEGVSAFGRTFAHLAGSPIEWDLPGALARPALATAA